MAAFDALRGDPALDADGLARLRELATFVQTVRTEQTRIQEAAAQVASELDDLTATVHGPEGGDGDGEPGDGGEAEETPAEGEAGGAAAAGAGCRIARAAGGPQAAEAEGRHAGHVGGGEGGGGRAARAARAPVRQRHGAGVGVRRQVAGFPRGAQVQTRIKQNVARVELPVDQAALGRHRAPPLDAGKLATSTRNRAVFQCSGSAAAVSGRTECDRRSVAGVQVLMTPADRDGRRWRLEVLSTGRIRVYERVAGRLVSTPLREVRDVRELGVWLLDRGIDPEQLVAG